MSDSLETGLSEAADQLAAFADGPARQAADTIGDAFSQTGRTIASALGSAARSGELSIKGLAASILKDLSSLAIQQFVTAPLRDLFAGLGAGVVRSLGLPSSGGLAGARAAGGPVTPGSPYLVGERGPELFVPSVTGAIRPGGDASAPPPVTVHIHLGQGASLHEVRRSSVQVAAALAKAVQRGSRVL